MRFDLPQRQPPLLPGGTAGVGDLDQPVASVGRVRAPGDEPGPLQVVDQVREHRAVDADLLGDRALVSGRPVGRRGEQLVAARAAGKSVSACSAART